MDRSSAMRLSQAVVVGVELESRVRLDRGGDEGGDVEGQAFSRTHEAA